LRATANVRKAVVSASAVGDGKTVKFSAADVKNSSVNLVMEKGAPAGLAMHFLVREFWRARRTGFSNRLWKKILRETSKLSNQVLAISIIHFKESVSFKKKIINHT